MRNIYIPGTVRTKDDTLISFKKILPLIRLKRFTTKDTIVYFAILFETFISLNKNDKLNTCQSVFSLLIKGRLRARREAGKRVVLQK